MLPYTSTSSRLLSSLMTYPVVHEDIRVECSGLGWSGAHIGWMPIVRFLRPAIRAHQPTLDVVRAIDDSREPVCCSYRDDGDHWEHKEGM